MKTRFDIELKKCFPKSLSYILFLDGFMVLDEERKEILVNSIGDFEISFEETETFIKSYQEDVLWNIKNNPGELTEALLEYCNRNKDGRNQ